MTNKKMTHTAVARGCDARIDKDKRWLIEIRETKKYWIDRHGARYSKTHGRRCGDWPLSRIEIESIKEIEEKS